MKFNVRSCYEKFTSCGLGQSSICSNEFIIYYYVNNREYVLALLYNRDNCL